MSVPQSDLGVILQECMEGRLSPEMALMRLILESEDAGELNAFLAKQSASAARRMPADRLAALSTLVEQFADAWPAVRATAVAVRHEPHSASATRASAGLASAFDRAARTSPEASVALYSFGSPERLDMTTIEIVAWLEAWGVLQPDRDFLDIGCGIGRLEIRLHNKVRSIVGVDASSEMVRIARGRCASLGNVEIRRTSGLGLEEFGDKSFDASSPSTPSPTSSSPGETLPSITSRRQPEY